MAREWTANRSAYSKEWKRRNPEKVEVYIQRSRANKALRKDEINEKKRANRKAVAESTDPVVVAQREAKRTKVRVQNKAWRDKNPDKVREMARLTAEKHKDKVKARKAKYWQKAKAAQSARYKKWQQENPDSGRVRNARRKARKLGADGTHTVKDRQDQFKRQRGKCFYCKKKLGRKYHLDHVTPLSKGGRDSPDNLVIACPTCNCRKHARDPQDFAGILL